MIVNTWYGGCALARLTSSEGAIGEVYIIVRLDGIWKKEK
jgi:hypothetical protein